MLIPKLIELDLNNSRDTNNVNPDESKNLIKKRCADLGISKIVNLETGKLYRGTSWEDVKPEIQAAVHKKEKALMKSHFLITPSKKQVLIAIDFLELLAALTFKHGKTSKQAKKMVTELEQLRKKISISRSTLKSNAKVTISKINEFFAVLSSSKQQAFINPVDKAQKIIKKYFQ